MSQPSAAEQQWRRAQRRERGQRGLRLIVIAGLVGLLVGLAQSPLFRIAEVVVQAPDAELEQAVRQSLALPPEASALLYPVSDLERQLRRVPEVLTARVERELPQRLVVRVQRREPVAALQVAERVFLVGSDGVLIRPCAEQAEFAQIPRFVGLAVAEPHPGGQLEPEAAGLLQEVLAAVHSGELTGALEFDASHGLDLRMHWAEVEGLLGGRDNLTRKILLFAHILRALEDEGQRPAYLDVRVMERPTWKPR